MRIVGMTLAVVFAASVAGCRAQQPASKRTERPRPVATAAQSDLPPPGRPVVGKAPPMPTPVPMPTLSNYRVEVFASGLVIPWGIVFASPNRAYVTERTGRVRLIENGKLHPEPYAVVRSTPSGEGGLMGIALHPSYPNPRWVYLMYSYRSGGAIYNRVSRFADTGSGLAEEKAIVTGIPGQMFHDGGIIRFGPDGMLYVGTGDGGEPERAQDKSSLSGKILRITPEGRVPKDNPFPGSFVYAYGFRNVQGLAWNPENGDLWATNHGPTGEFGLEARDSVFIVQRGGNHGWPRALGVTGLKSVVAPVMFFPDSAVPPAAAMFCTGRLMPELRGNFFFASLRGEHLERVILSAPRTISRVERWFEIGTHNGRYGRLRAVAQGPDGAIYVSTSNRDGRGEVRAGDDKVLRIVPK